MKKIVFAVIVIFGLTLFGGLVQAQITAASYKVVVNTSNPISSMTKTQVSRLFLKDVTKWDDGQRVLPVDLSLRSPLRETFSQDILDKSTAMVKNYWIKNVFSGRETPPPEKRSAAEVLYYVDENPGAIGYVPASELHDKFKVKVLDIRK